MSLTRVQGVVLPLENDLKSASGSNIVGYGDSNVGEEIDKFNQNTANFVTRITDFGAGFANWPQGKGVVVGNTAYFGFNLASGHGTIVSDAMMVSTTDGINFGKVRTIAKRTETEGATSWSLGAINSGETLVSIVRFRKGANDQAPIRHSIYTSSNKGVSWNEVSAIPFKTKDDKEVVSYHGFVLHGDGKFSVGYHDAIGNLGVLTFNPEDWSYKDTILLRAEDNNRNGSVLQCELNFLRRADNGNIIMVSRSQNVGVSKCKQWIGNDALTSISTPVDVPVPFSVNPISPVYSPDFKEVWFIYANRYDNVNLNAQQSGVWVIKRTLNEAFTQNWNDSNPINLVRTSAGYSSEAGIGGVQHAVTLGQKILIAFPSKVENSSSRSDVYCMNVEFRGEYKDCQTGQPLGSLTGSNSDSFAELKLSGNSMYDPRIRFNGQSLLTLNDSTLMIGTYGSGFTQGLGFYNSTGDSTQTPAMYIQPTTVSYDGAKGPIDINRSLRLFKKGTTIHLGEEFRIRVGGNANTTGASLLYHNSTNNTIEIGTTQDAYKMDILMYSANGVTFKRSPNVGANAAVNVLLADSSGNTVRLAGGINGFYVATPSTSSALRVQNDGSIVAARTVSGISTTVEKLPTGSEIGGMAYATNGRKSGEAIGAGTGCPVFWNGSVWLTFYDNTQVQK